MKLEALLIGSAVLLVSSCGDEAANGTSCPKGQAPDAAGACRPTCVAGADCDDGDACNGLEVCLHGLCYGGTPVLSAECRPCASGCDDGDPCTDDACNGPYCSHTSNTAPCDDGLACTTGDACRDGICEPGTPDDAACADAVSCTVDRCQAGVGCTHVASDEACDDSLACTVDTCDETADCHHEPIDALCHDGLPCTADACAVGQGCVSTPVDAACDDHVACTIDSCDSVSGCRFIPSDMACDDGVSCTRDRCGRDARFCSEPDDRLCALGPCVSGACDPVADCALVDAPNLMACDGDGLCISGECTLLTQGQPVRSAPAQCQPTAYEVDDLVYSSAEGGFFALADSTVGTWTGSACTAEAVRTRLNLHRGDNYAPYGADLAGRGEAIVQRFALARVSGAHRVGMIDTGADSVDWGNSNWIETGLDATAGVGELVAGTYFATGNLLSRTAVGRLLLVGRSAVTPANGIVVSWSWLLTPLCIIGQPCPPPPSCTLTTTLTNTTFTAVEAWTSFSGPTASYLNAAATVNVAAGYGDIVIDGANKDLSLTTFAPGLTASRSYGGLTPAGAPGATLAFGGSIQDSLDSWFPGVNVCLDDQMDGTAVWCDTLNGPGWQQYYKFYDATSLPGGGIALLASSCETTCAVTTYTLVTVRTDRPLGQAAWEERVLAISDAAPSPVPHRIASGGGELLVLGVDDEGTGPYAWRFAP